ncbi:BTAD domain-containing putative transcriptional regulator [Catenulispora rubra]|uniref:BTAD domain-containing putative transcriptional regulator n=1 Tax=Catenulispora rubra TaxID=280293 RepID=UPI00189242FB|nr:BTAD domain-containing putative transcriptional regulator [Catenulispora rubra]
MVHDSDRQYLAPQGPPPGLAQAQAQQTPVALKRQRSAADVVTGLAALLALLALVIGVPLALAYFVGWPLPHKMPSGGLLNATIDTKTFTNVLAILVWLAWAQFSACVLVEALAAARGIGMPGHVPLSGGSQILARQLVAAVLLITASAASFAPGLSSLGRTPDDGPHRAPVAVTQVLQQGTRADAPMPSGPAARTATNIDARTATDLKATPVKGATKFYRVQPPAGRHHDSLWEIAQRHLGDGRRYQEIYELNKDRVQPDGSTLTKASLIRPGWILEMPADAVGGDLVGDPAAPVQAQAHPQTQAQTPMDTGRSPHQQGAPAGALDASDNDVSASEQTMNLAAVTDDGPGKRSDAIQIIVGDLSQNPQTHPTQQAPHQTSTTPTPTNTSAHHEQTPAGDQSPYRLPLELVSAPLLAAGLLGALTRNRTRQLWNRAAGRRLSGPGDAAGAEEAIRLGAGMADVRFLNQALRELSASLATAGRPLPAVQLANLTGSGLELRLAEPAPAAPQPWHTRPDGLAWWVARTDVGTVAKRVMEAAVAPCPGLVTVGAVGPDAATRVLLDLEASCGVISVGGDDAMRRAVLAAMAVELLTNTWSDKMTVTLVGFAGDLTTLAPGRVHQTQSLEEVLPGLETELAERRRGLSEAGLDSVLGGRLGMVGGAGWPPHFIISAAPVSGPTAARLAAVVGDPSRVGIGYLIAGDVPGATWKATVDAAGRFRLPALDLDVAAQRLPDDQYRSVLALFEATRDLDGEPILPLTAEAAVLEAQLRLTPTVSVRLLGNLEITGAYGDLDEDRVDQAAEALTFLMLHRDGVHPRVLTSALFPRGASNEVGDQVLHRMGTWLGVAPDGSPNLVTLPDGRLTVSQSVRSDWEMFKNMRALADADPRYQDAKNRDQVLGQALGLVRGPLLAHRDASRYGWLAYESVEAEVPALIADTAVELCELRLSLGDAEGAIDAVRSGMRGSPSDEELCRALLRATHATGDEQRLREVIATVEEQTRAIHGERGLHPRTEALVDELLPSWREGHGAVAVGV